MKKAFIFDLDGVLIDSEPAWEIQKAEMFPRVLGKDISEKLGSTLGVHIDAIYSRAKDLGSPINKQDIVDSILQAAPAIYDNAPLTQDMDKLVDFLVANDYLIAIVSSSPKDWVDRVIARLSFKEHVELIISLYELNQINQKPAPDGYLHAIKILGATPKSTVILEDSNTGIESAKSSGAFTIAFKANLIDGYKQKAADASASTVQEVIKIIQTRKYT